MARKLHLCHTHRNRRRRDELCISNRLRSGESSLNVIFSSVRILQGEYHYLDQSWSQEHEGTGASEASAQSQEVELDRRFERTVEIKREDVVSDKLLLFCDVSMAIVKSREDATREGKPVQVDKAGCCRYRFYGYRRSCQ